MCMLLVQYASGFKCSMLSLSSSINEHHLRCSNICKYGNDIGMLIYPCTYMHSKISANIVVDIQVFYVCYFMSTVNWMYFIVTYCNMNFQPEGIKSLNKKMVFIVTLMYASSRFITNTNKYGSSCLQPECILSMFEL